MPELQTLARRQRFQGGVISTRYLRGVVLIGGPRSGRKCPDMLVRDTYLLRPAAVTVSLPGHASELARPRNPLLMYKLSFAVAERNGRIHNAIPTFVSARDSNHKYRSQGVKLLFSATTEKAAEAGIGTLTARPRAGSCPSQLPENKVCRKHATSFVHVIAFHINSLSRSRASIYRC